MERLDRFDRRNRRRRRLHYINRRIIRDRSNPLEVYDEEQFKRRYHLAKGTVIFVLNKIHEYISQEVIRGSPIPALHQLLVALSFFSTGSFQLLVGDNLEISQPSVSNIVKRVSRAIAKLSKEFIKFPTRDEAVEVRQKFFRVGGFPGMKLNC